MDQEGELGSTAYCLVGSSLKDLERSSSHPKSFHILLPVF